MSAILSRDTGPHLYSNLNIDMARSIFVHFDLTGSAVKRILLLGVCFCRLAVRWGLVYEPYTVHRDRIQRVEQPLISGKSHSKVISEYMIAYYSDTNTRCV